MRFSMSGSVSNFRRVACMAPSIGTLMNSDSTSKDTMSSLSRIFSLLMMDEKLAELVAVKSELPDKGDKILAKKADKSYAKVFTQDTIGLNSMLWISGKS